MALRQTFVLALCLLLGATAATPAAQNRLLGHWKLVGRSDFAAQRGWTCSQTEMVFAAAQQIIIENGQQRSEYAEYNDEGGDVAFVWGNLGLNTRVGYKILGPDDIKSNDAFECHYRRV